MKLVKFKQTLFLALTCLYGYAHALTLQEVNFAELPGDKAEIRLSFDSMPSEPAGYTIDRPSRIVLDFPGVENGLSQKKYAMSAGSISSAVVVSGGGRTRVILNLDSIQPYRTRTEGSELIVEVGTESIARAGQSSASVGVKVPSPSNVNQPVIDTSSSAIQSVDFRRGELGEGKVLIGLSNPGINIDVEEVSGGIEVRFVGAEIPQELRRKLDVVDFATPVSMLRASADGNSAVISIDAEGDFDYLAYQADNEYVVSVKPLTQKEIEDKKKKFAYVGERLSLNFQDIQVRSVLQLLADSNELNLVASDTVSGSITLRLDNVPWDQAFDIVLKSKGLDKRQMGNVLMVAPAAEIAERERQEIETQKQLEELAPLRTEYIRIRYANARELFSLFSEGSGGGGGSEDSGDRNSTGSILSDRGQAIVDERTNSIILTDTQEKISAFKALVEKIDIPVRQVMIEARIVIANNNFKKELGVRISGDAVETSPSGNRMYEFTGRQEGLINDSGVGGPGQLFVDSNGDGVADGTRNLRNSNLVNLGVQAANAGALSWNVIGSNFLLGMELSALEESGFAEIVSQPKVITGDKQQATIKNGTQIAYTEESASGGTTVAFKDAVLKLDVTPQITPDNRVIMDLVINQDSVSGFDGGIPSIDVTELKTKVLVADGETIVLGGIYQVESVDSQSKIPLLGDIPLLGRLFRNDLNSEKKRELLLFITPRIMSSDLID